MWFKESQLEFLASTQEQVLTSRDDEAHHWRTWQKVWFRHRESQRVILGANVHTIDGNRERKIKGDAEKRTNFKSRCVQSILDQVVETVMCPDFPGPSRDAGQPEDSFFPTAGSEASQKKFSGTQYFARDSVYSQAFFLAFGRYVS